MSTRSIFRNVLKLKSQEQRVFVPFLNGLAAKITQTPLRTMAWDPSFYVHALEDSNRLFGSHVVATPFDPTVEAECCGCEVNWPENYDEPYLNQDCEMHMISPENFVNAGRIPVIIEATKRLSVSLGRDTGLACVVTGPCTLGRTLISRSGPFKESTPNEAISFASVLLKHYVKRLCELKVDAVIFREDTLGGHFVNDFRDCNEILIQTYKTLSNIIKFYNSFCLIMLSDILGDDLEEICERLKPNGIILTGQLLDKGDLQALKAFSELQRISVGLSLPLDETEESKLWNQLELFEAFIIDFNPKGFFYTSNGAISHHTPIEVIHNLVERISQN